jgi:hypothetical protein
VPAGVTAAIDLALVKALPKSSGAREGAVSFTFVPDHKGGLTGGGLSLHVLNNPQEYALMLTAQHALRQLRQRDGSADKAIQDFFGALKPSMESGEAAHISKFLKGGKS